jgi:predicted kinase
MCLAANKQTPADTVDHIIPHCGDYALFWDSGNYQSLCKKCHDTKTYYETVRTRKLPPWLEPKSKDIILLFGPPASGKTTWAFKQKESTVVDLDVIKEKISNQNPYEMDDRFMSMCFAIRNKMIADTRGKMIVIATLSNTKHRKSWVGQLKAKPYLMSTPMHVCMERIDNDERRTDKEKHKALVRAWFKEYIPTGNERFIL